MAAPEALSHDKREAILDGAATVFAAHGYEGASISMITAAAQVSRGTIYQHFAGKAELFGAAVGRECDRRLGFLLNDIGPELSLPAALAHIGHGLVAILASPDALALERTVTAEASRFPELAEAFYQAGPVRAVGAMARFLSARAARGELVIDDASFAAEQFFMLCQTRVVMRARLGMACPEADRAVAGAVRVFLAAYGRQ